MHIALSFILVPILVLQSYKIHSFGFHSLSTYNIHQMQPFSSSEVDKTITSLKRIVKSDRINDFNWLEINEFISSSAHQPHKEWSLTESSADKLYSLIGGLDDEKFRYMFNRVLEDGNWDNAKSATSSRQLNKFKPWVVLVTGVNGIRKTTSVYQPWFKTVLQQALGNSFDGLKEELPDGNDSFFRQLDYMIATLGLYTHENNLLFYNYYILVFIFSIDFN